MPMTVLPWHQTAWNGLLARKTTLPHALLLRGREGTGKLDFARKFAQSLACETPETDGTACGTCRSCRWFASGSHPDYRELRPEALRLADGEELADGAEEEDSIGDGEGSGKRRRKPGEEIKIEEVRGLRDFIHLSAHHDSGKTIVLYPAETLNTSAANALLKNLEEPPPGTRFILVSHRPYYLPATIISRCQQIALPTPSAAVAEQWLREQGVAEPALSLAQTGNAPLAALQLAADDYWTHRKTVLGALSARGFNALELAEHARDYPPPRLLEWLQRWSYDLLLKKTAGRVRYNPDFEAALAQAAKPLDALQLARYHRMLVGWQRIVNHPLNARLFIEQILLSYTLLLRGEENGATGFPGHAG